MELDAVIANLNAARTGARSLDVEIAQVLGWHTADVPFTDETGASGFRPGWISPVTGEPARIPYYTTQLEAALELLQTVAPTSAIACSWKKGSGSVSVDTDDEVFLGGSPHLALCIAALIYLRRQSST